MEETLKDRAIELANKVTDNEEMKKVIVMCYELAAKSEAYNSMKKILYYATDRIDAFHDLYLWNSKGETEISSVTEFQKELLAKAKELCDGYEG